MFRSLAFIFWFARNDLTSRVAVWTTANCFFSYFVVLTVALLSWGLLGGYAAIREHRIDRQPLARCMWVGSHRVESFRITANQVQALRAEVPAQLASTARFKGCYPFAVVDYGFLTQGDTNEPVIRGRTLSDGDPLLAGLSFAAGKPFASSAEKGLVVTRSLLQRLNYLSSDSSGEPNEQSETADSIPSDLTLSVRVADGSLVKLPVVGVIDEHLPFNHQFVVTETIHLQQLAEHPNVAASWIKTGPIPDEWPEPGQLPADVAQAVDKLRLSEPIVDEHNRQRCWRLESNQEIVASTWRLYVQQIAALIAAADEKDAAVKYSLAPSFDQIVLDPVALAEVKPAENPHDMAAVYVSELADFPQVAKVCDAQQIVYDKTVIKQLERLGRDIQDARLMLVGVLGLIALMAVLNITSIQHLVAKQKVAEIGMLKAMGMGPWIVLFIFVCEALLISSPASLLAVCTARFFGPWLAPSFLGAQTSAERAISYSTSPADFWTMVLVALVIYICSTLAATHWARTQPPLKTLAASG